MRVNVNIYGVHTLLSRCSTIFILKAIHTHTRTQATQFYSGVSPSPCVCYSLLGFELFVVRLFIYLFRCVSLFCHHNRFRTLRVSIKNNKIIFVCVDNSNCLSVSVCVSRLYCFTRLQMLRRSCNNNIEWHDNNNNTTTVSSGSKVCSHWHKQ